MIEIIKKWFFKKEEALKEEPSQSVELPDDSLVSIHRWIHNIDKANNNRFIAWNTVDNDDWDEEKDCRVKVRSFTIADDTGKGIAISRHYEGPSLKKWRRSNTWEPSILFLLEDVACSVNNGEEIKKLSSSTLLDINLKDANKPLLKEIYKCARDLYFVSKEYKEKCKKERLEQEENRQKDQEILDAFIQES